MAESDPLSQMFNLFAAPLAGTIQSFEQFRRGVDEFLRGVENFNRTMENLNETAERVNRFVDDVEGPLRASIPQFTRTVEAADEMMQVISGPAMAAAPGLERLAKTLTTPAFAQLPAQLGQFSDVMADIQTRLGPLTQLAESAGGLFGAFRMPTTSPQRPEDDSGEVVVVAAEVSDTDAEESAHDDRWETSPSTPSARNRTTANKAPKKRAARKKAAAKKTARKKPATNKAAEKKR